MNRGLSTTATAPWIHGAGQKGYVIRARIQGDAAVLRADLTNRFLVWTEKGAASPVETANRTRQL